MNSNWAIHNSLKAWTLYNLSEVEVNLLISTLTENEVKLARVCKKGELWVPLDRNKHVELFNLKHIELFKNANDYKDLNAGLLESGGTADTEFFIVKTPKVIYQRQHKRFELKVPCQVLGFNREFATFTKDISEGGLYFNDLIPDWVAGYFIVMVNDQFQLMCSIVEDQKEKFRVQIVSEERDVHFIKYKDWLGTL